MQRVTLIIPAKNTELYAQKKVRKHTFSLKARPDMQPVFGSPYLAKADGIHPYSADWKKPIFEKFSGEVIKDTAGRIDRG